MEILKQVILNNLPAKSKHTSKCISLNCPCCIYMGEPRPDTRGRGGLFIEGDSIGYNCFNCRFKCRQEKGQKLTFKMKKFMELLGVPSSDINRAQLESLKSSSVSYSVLGLETKKAYTPKVDVDFKPVNIPTNTVLIHDVISETDNTNLIDVYNYAIDRGIDNYPFLMWCNDKAHRLNRRLIVPYMFKGNVVGYTARLIDKCSKQERYYTQSPNSSKYVFNMDSIYKDRKFLIVNESPLDSILYDGVATMNFEPTPNQIRLINEFKGKKIVVPDFGSGGMKMIETAINNGWSVYYPDWNTNFDLGEATQVYGKLFILDRILKNAIDNPIKIKVKSRIYKENFS